MAVTDGEASHARSTRICAAALRERRAHERDEALARLGVPEVTLHRLGAAGPGLRRPRRRDRRDAVAGILAPGDVVVAPSPRDRHPDHVAVARRRGAPRPTPWRPCGWRRRGRSSTAPPRCRRPTLELDETAWAAKQHAVAAYRSQLEALGPDAVDGPVVHPDELAAIARRDASSSTGRRCDLMRDTRHVLRGAVGVVAPTRGTTPGAGTRPASTTSPSPRSRARATATRSSRPAASVS